MQRPWSQFSAWEKELLLSQSVLRYKESKQGCLPNTGVHMYKHINKVGETLMKILGLGMVMPACNPSTKETEPKG